MGNRELRKHGGELVKNGKEGRFYGLKAVSGKGVKL